MMISRNLLSVLFGANGVFGIFGHSQWIYDLQGRGVYKCATHDDQPKLRIFGTKIIGSTLMTQK